MPKAFDDKLTQRARDCMLDMLQHPALQSGVCPRDVAQVLADDVGCAWQDLMRVVRRAAQELAEHGAIEITQHGTPVHIHDARGPVRLQPKTARGG